MLSQPTLPTKIDYISFPADSLRGSQALNADVECLASGFNSRVTLIAAAEVDLAFRSDHMVLVVESITQA